MTKTPNPNLDKAEDTAFGDEEVPFSWRDYGVEDPLVFVVFWALAVLVFAQFFTRYVLNDPFAWSEEIARYLLIWLCFLGATIGFRKNSHIYVEFFLRYFRPSVVAVFNAIVDVIRIVFLGLLTWAGVKIIPVMKTQTMTALPIPLTYIYAVVLLGLVIMTIRSIIFAYRRWRYGDPDDALNADRSTATTD